MSNFENIVLEVFDDVKEFDKYNSFNKSTMYRWSNAEEGSEKHSQLLQAVHGAKSLQMRGKYGRDSEK